MSEKACDWCGRPNSEQAVEPHMVGDTPMMLCTECRGEPVSLPAEACEDCERPGAAWCLHDGAPKLLCESCREVKS